MGLAQILTQLRAGDILFIDAIDRLPKPCNPLLSNAMTTFILHIEAGEGSQVKAVDIDLRQFTLVGATSRPSLLKHSLKNCFKQQLLLQDYPDSSSISN
jgi:Holliday junction DNA helicase RuvB